MHRRSFVPVYDPQYYDSPEEFTEHNFTYTDYLEPKREKRQVSPVFVVNDDFEPMYAMEYYSDIEIIRMQNDNMVPKHDNLKRSELGMRMSKMNTSECPVCKCDIIAKDIPVTENSCLMQLNTTKSRRDATDTPEEPKMPMKKLPSCKNDSVLLHKFNTGMGDVAFVFRINIEEYHHWEHHFHIADFRMFLRPNATDWKIMHLQVTLQKSSIEISNKISRQQYISE